MIGDGRCRKRQQRKTAKVSPRNGSYLPLSNIHRIGSVSQVNIVHEDYFPSNGQGMDSLLETNAEYEFT